MKKWIFEFIESGSILLEEQTTTSWGVGLLLETDESNQLCIDFQIDCMERFESPSSLCNLLYLWLHSWRVLEAKGKFPRKLSARGLKLPSWPRCWDIHQRKNLNVVSLTPRHRQFCSFLMKNLHLASLAGGKLVFKALSRAWFMTQPPANYQLAFRFHRMLHWRHGCSLSSPFLTARKTNKTRRRIFMGICASSTFLWNISGHLYVRSFLQGHHSQIIRNKRRKGERNVYIKTSCRRPLENCENVIDFDIVRAFPPFRPSFSPHQRQPATTVNMKT